MFLGRDMTYPERFFLGGVLFASLMAAHAQDTEEDSASRGYSAVIEEVLVTAQQREEGAMSTPVTVNAFTAEDIVNTGALSIQEISDFMPGVEIGDGSTTQTGISIRGVSSPNISSGGDPSTATFYDGAYVPRAATTIPFSDLGRVEVLMGPQGTLFGRNATAGVINMVPNAPSNELEGYFRARLGNYGLQRYEGMLNVPINDALAVRMNALTSDRDGIVKNVGIGPEPGDEGVTVARVSVLFQPSEKTSLQFSLDVEDRDEAPRTAIGVGPYAYGETEVERLNPFSGTTEHDVAGARETREMSGYSLKLNTDLTEELSLFAISSFRDWETENLEEEDGTADPRRYFDTNNIEDSDIWYNEARLSYVRGDMDLILGITYSQEDLLQITDVHLTTDAYMQYLTVRSVDEEERAATQVAHAWGIYGEDEATYLFISDQLGVAFVPPSMAGVLITESMENTGDFENWGIFADLSYSLSDRWRVAGGLRYSQDDKSYTWRTNPSDLDWPIAPVILNYDPGDIDDDPSNDYALYERSDSWSKVTGRLVVDWQFSDQAMAYASVATGYRSGGFDGQTFRSLIVDPFDPEETTNYELGLKGDFLDERLRIEAALFYMELDNKQETRSTKDSPDDPTASPKVVSGGEEIEGIELIATLGITDDLRLEISSTYRESESVLEPYFDAAGEPAGGDTQISRADTDYTLRLDWTPEVPTGYLLVHMDYVFEEEGGPDANSVIFYEGPWYYQDKKQLSARIAWQNFSETLEVALWGRNLLDEEYATNPGGFVADPSNGLAAAHTRLDDPLTWGLDFRWSFF